jgi:GDP-L-fucose synthase
MRRQRGRHWISAMSTNPYGSGDNFDPAGSHVLPAMIRRFHEAKLASAGSVTIWGTGDPRREFLHVDDLAGACPYLLEHYDDDVAINVGTGTDVSIRELAQLVAGIVGWHGTMLFDTSKPDGTPRKLLDVQRLDQLGWKASIPLADGIASTYEWYLQNEATLRR